MKVTAIVQARSNSFRLKGKMHAVLYDYNILEWVLLRLKKSKKINKFIVATTNKKEDLPIVNLAKKMNYKVFKGNEKNVLQRFYFCARKFKSRSILRVCADNPFVDQKEIDKLINYFIKNNYNYVYNTMQTQENKSADGFGAEIFDFKTLQRVYLEANSRKDKEHVTRYIRKNKKLFSIKCIKPNHELAFPYLRFDINTLKDFNFIKKIIKKFKIKIQTPAKKNC